jgi:hypothetical protein
MRALERGTLRGGQTVVEMTSGNMGAALAVVCGVLVHPFVAVISAGNSPLPRLFARTFEVARRAAFERLDLRCDIVDRFFVERLRIEALPASFSSKEQCAWRIGAFASAASPSNVAYRDRYREVCMIYCISQR